MTIRGKAYIAGAFEHPGRELPDHSTAQVHAEVARGALADAGLSVSDVDAFLTDGTMFGTPNQLAEYLGLDRLSYVDLTNTGGSSYMAHVGHAAAAIAAGKCSVALITLAGRPRTEGRREPRRPGSPEAAFEETYGTSAVGLYGMAAMRHMYEYGTTSAQLAEIKVAASYHAQFNPHALFPFEVSVEQVLESPMVSDPLHRLDCCVITDGGGALVVVSPEVARQLPRATAKVLGHGEAILHTRGGHMDVTTTGAVWSGPRAFTEARVTPQDVKYASIYDSFTITALEAIEDLGFCEKGQGGRFVMDGALLAPHGVLPINTDGGGLSSNHPANMGGMTKIIEAVRQVRGEAHPKVQVPNCDIAIAHGTGGRLSTRMTSVTLVLGAPDA